MTSSPMDSATVVRTLFQKFFNEGDEQIVDTLVAEKYDFHNGSPSAPRTRDRFKAGIARIRQSFPDMHWEIGLLLVDGDMVAVRSTLTGTHLGEFMGLPPSGKRAIAGIADFYRFENGVIVEHWDVVDQLAVLLRIGADLPEPIVTSADAWGLVTVQ